ncbi:4-hydroxythreonine-4-phosphate dehydrogenase PdxA [Thorsellia kenyensis]|uniref:4-hydroxythreonine-4-phosphate dehydrogenase PdxA n=1 Tax=Thorsellia kenyensis TaxID=1549888 RepID=A0ABV6C6U6_9GAMM
MLKNKPIIISAGEPAGIGPDIVLMLLQKVGTEGIVVCIDKLLLKQRAEQANIQIEIKDYCADTYGSVSTASLSCNESRKKTLIITVLHVPLKAEVIAGELNALNSHYVLEVLTRASIGCMQGEFSALLTGPVHKGIINEAGVLFSGHTEFLADIANVEKVVMVLATKIMKVGLATTHIPLNKVSETITKESLQQVLEIVHSELQNKYHKKHPKIYVCGLNPHAGEDGHLGREEIDTIIPVLQMLRDKGYDLIGPMPADTMFQPKYLDDADLILTMYHDQGLPVLKYQGFGEAINITFGLPFLRVSVDHGTALDMAGTFTANPGSMIAAYEHIKGLV